MNKEILDQIDVLLKEIPLSEYSIKGVNCLLPCDCSQDVKKLICPLLIELKEFLGKEDYDSYKFGYFLTEKFEAALKLELTFPDEILAKLLNLFYSIIFEVENLVYGVKKSTAQLLTELLKKSKKIDKKLFKADWKKLFKLVDSFYYAKLENCPGFHSYQSSSCSSFIELTKHIRRFFPNEAVDEILNEFENDLLAFHSKEALRSVRFIALLTPFEGLKEAQIQRIFEISVIKVGKFKRISSQFDVFIVYMLRKVTKSNEEILKKFDWEPIGKFIFEQILPGALKIPSPVRGARKIPKLLNKSDVSLSEEFFESLGKNLPSSISKLLVYMMEGDHYETTIHTKLLFFLDSLRNLCHPSNHGSWSIQIEMFLGYFAETMAKKSKKEGTRLRGAFVDVIVEKIWNLSELLVFARSGPSLSGLCISTFTCTNLANVRPDLIIPKIILSVSAALESVSEPHRTTSAIGLLQVSMPKLLKSPLGIGPVLNLLSTVVFGIDSNDQLKSIRTLTLFNSFSESAIIKDISSESFDLEWTEACQVAKELTGQYPDIFLLFTENIISYLRTISQNASGSSTNEHEDLSRLILAISSSVYRLVSKEIAEICLEKWLNLFEEDLGMMVTEIVGEISGKLAKNHSIPIYDRFIPKLISKISYHMERGDGQLGSKDQSNNSLNNNLIILSHLLETGSEFVKSNFKELSEMILKTLNSITNRKSFLAGSRLFHSIVIGLIHYEIKELEVEIIGNPFVYWSKWIEFEDLKREKDFKFKIPSESDGLMALELLENILNWTKGQVKGFKISTGTLTKGESEKLYCIMQVIDNLNIDLWNFYNNFSSYNYGINSDLSIESVSKGALKLFKDNLGILISLVPVIESTGNLELEIQLGDVIGSVINGYPIHPEKSNEKLRAIKALDGGYKGVESDKKRPKSFLTLQAEAQFKLRRDLRYNFGDLELETVLMKEFDDLSEVLFKYCFKPYHMIRAAAQIDIRRFTYKYIEKARGFIIKTLELVELNENLSEPEFKGVLFLMRSRFSDIICEDFVLIDRYLRCLLKLGEMPVSEDINESFEILSGTLNAFTDAFVPDERYDKVKVKKLVLDLMRIADEKSEKWTIQYLAMLSAHPLIEQCHVPELFSLLAKFSLSKVSVIRNIAQNCFKVTMFGHVKAVDETFWRYRDLTALDVERSQELAKVPEVRLKEWTEEEFEGFCEFFKEYFKFLCLTDDDEGSDGGSLQFEYMNFIYLGRWINLFGSKEEEMFLKIVEELFSIEGGPLDLGKQRALCEIICAIICNYPNVENEIILKLLRRCWNNLAIENLELWTTAIDEVLMWKLPILNEISSFFDNSKSNETSKIILGIKMISIIYNQIGLVGNWINEERLKGKLVELCGHEYTSVVMEAGKLLALISLRGQQKGGYECLSDLSDSTMLSDLYIDLGVSRLLTTCNYNDSANVANSDNFNRAILHFLACSSTIPNLSNYWKLLNDFLENLLKMLQSENVQMLTDAKKAILTLFLSKGADLNDLNLLTEKILKFVTAEQAEIPVKISKFCLELIQLLLQNNFSLFHIEGSVEEFFKKHVDILIENDEIHLREASHGITLTLYQIDSSKLEKDVEKVTKRLMSLRSSIKSEKGLKERHSAVIRGSAIVLSEPHVISEHLPALLTALSYYISDRSPISPLVRTTFSEFRRTHQDNWQNDRQLFDEDQLDAIGELLIAPSYYA